MSVTVHILPQHHNREVHLHHRDKLRRRLVNDDGSLIPRQEAKLGHVAPTALPVDCTGDAGFVDPIDLNDKEGDCGSAMVAHVDTIWTYGQGKPGFGPQLVADVAKLGAQYLRVAGGDNGLAETQLTGPGGIWRVGVADDPSAVIADAMDISATDLQLRRYCTDQFYAVCMGWSVPDTFINSFHTGASFLSPGVANPNNGHWSPLADLDTSGSTRVITWGGWAWVSDLFLASVDPDYFVVFSHLQFNAAGYDSHGRHVSEQAAKWKLLGGNGPAVDAVVALFPAATPTTPPPAPAPSVPPPPPPPPSTPPAPPAPPSVPPAPPSTQPAPPSTPSAGPPSAGPPSAGPPSAGPPSAGPPSAGPAGPPAAGPKCTITHPGWECPLPAGHLGACPAVRSPQ